MAPDIEFLANGGNSNLSSDTNGMAIARNGGHQSHDSEAYSIPDITYYSPQNRKLKVITIGAGVSGILMAYNIQKYCENVEHAIYEQHEDIGG